MTGLANSVNFDDDIGPGTFMEWAVGKEGEIFPDPRQWVGTARAPSTRWPTPGST